MSELARPTGTELQPVVVDFDLDAMFGTTRTIRAAGRVWHLPADPPLEFMSKALALNARYVDAQRAADDEATQQVLGDLIPMLHDLFDSCPENGGERPRLGMQGLMAALSIAMGADPAEVTLEQLATQALTGEPIDPDESERSHQPDPEPGDPPTAPPDDPAAPVTV